MCKDFKAFCCVSLWFLCGCDQLPQNVSFVPVASPPTQEWFIGMPRGLPIEVGDEVRAHIEATLESAPAGTHFHFFLVDNQELLASLTVPEGSAAYRRKIARRRLKKVYERLDPELSGGSRDVKLIAVPASVRQYRQSQLPPVVIVIGSPLIVDHEQGLSITPKHLPCEGLVTAADSSYGAMAKFPPKTTLRWHSIQADWGNGPNHRGEVVHFLRYLLQTKQGPLVRLSSDAAVVFNSNDPQWDDQVTPLDDCKGLKDVTPDEPPPTLFDKKGKAELLKPQLHRRILLQKPDPALLRGPTARVLFLIDTSGSVVIDAEGRDCRRLFIAMQTDLCEKLATMPFQQFAICGFGGWANLKPRLSKYPKSLMSALYWAEATPANRQAAIEFVKALEAGGGTPTYSALAEGLELDGPMTCVLYSDGVPTLGEGGQPAVLKLAEALGQRQVTINSVGVGALAGRAENFDWSGAEFLARIAQATSGKYFSLDTTATAN